MGKKLDKAGEVLTTVATVATAAGALIAALKGIKK